MTETLIASQARARFVVTLPHRPSLIGAELLRLSAASFTTFTDTSDAFLHLARRARERLVIMTPFIDTRGAAWAADIFEATSAVKKILVVRNSADLGVCGSEGLRLREVAQRIYDYTFRHGKPDGLVDIETFHAKIVLADGITAYVGSANFLYRSREVNLECGFLLEGDAVAPVSVLIDAILNILAPADTLSGAF